MILRLTTVHENARSALECGGSTPPYINLERDGQGGVKPPHSKVPSAQSFSWQRTNNWPKRVGTPSLHLQFTKLANSRRNHDLLVRELTHFQELRSGLRIAVGQGALTTRSRKRAVERGKGKWHICRLPQSSTRAAE